MGLAFFPSPGLVAEGPELGQEPGEGVGAPEMSATDTPRWSATDMLRRSATDMLRRSLDETPRHLLADTPRQSQPDTLRMSLGDAVSRALEANAALKAQRASATASAQLPLQASQAFLPSVSLGLQGMRTTDPVAVFGLKLRQERFAMEDLALDALNRPDAYSGYNATATVQLPLLAPEGLYGFAAARKAAEAQAAGASRAAGATRFFVIQAYTGAKMATLQVEALETALAAVRAHVRQAEAMRDQGLVTGLDARMAGLKASEIEVQRLAARAHAENALSALKAMLALPEATELRLSEELSAAAATSVCAGVEADCSWDRRGDLGAYAAGVDAASLGVKKAWASQLPALAAFGALGHYAKDAPFRNGSGDWTVGIGLSWSPFHGLAGVGAVRAARAEEAAARAQRENAVQQAEVEVLQARRMLEAAREGVLVAARAAEEARVALDQALLRYRTGTAPITELLDVQAAATNATLTELAARRDLLVAHAALDLAYGVYDR
jgi:outer membrane protein